MAQFILATAISITCKSILESIDWSKFPNWRGQDRSAKARADCATLPCQTYARRDFRTSLRQLFFQTGRERERQLKEKEIEGCWWCARPRASHFPVAVSSLSNDAPPRRRRGPPNSEGDEWKWNLNANVGHLTPDPITRCLALRQPHTRTSHFVPFFRLRGKMVHFAPNSIAVR